ncbi:MAG TPA: glycosyltransferase 87 family protein [Candidatus Methylomirabilis sp.]
MSSAGTPHLGRIFALTVVLGAGALVRLPFVAFDFHASADMDILRTWATSLRSQPMDTIYDDPSVNYPPVPLYLFRVGDAVVLSLSRAHQAMGEAPAVVVKLPGMLADLSTGALLAWMFRRQASPWPVLACALYVFNPAVWYVSAYWGQVDSVYVLFLAAALAAISEGAPLPAWGLFVLALASKPQSSVLAPLIPLLTLLRHGTRAALRGGGVAIAVAAAVTLPWLLAGRLSDPLGAYFRLTAASRVDVSGYNLWYLLLGGHVHNLSSLNRPVGLPLTYQQIGMVLFGTFAVAVMALVWRQRGRTLFVPAALLSLGFFLFATEIHERYLLPALAFLLMGAARGEGNPPGRSPGRPLAAQGLGPWNLELVLAYMVVTGTLMYNLVTIAPFTRALGSNLVYELSVDSGLRVRAMNAAALLAGVFNVLVASWLAWTILPRPVQDRPGGKEPGTGSGGRSRS